MLTVVKTATPSQGSEDCLGATGRRANRRPFGKSRGTHISTGHSPELLADLRALLAYNDRLSRHRRGRIRGSIPAAHPGNAVTGCCSEHNLPMVSCNGLKHPPQVLKEEWFLKPISHCTGQCAIGRTKPVEDCLPSGSVSAV